MKIDTREQAREEKLRIILVLSENNHKNSEVKAWFYGSQRYSHIDVITDVTRLPKYLRGDIRALPDMILIMDSTQSTEVEKTVAKLQLGKRIPVFKYSTEVNPFETKSYYQIGINNLPFAPDDKAGQQMIPEIVANCYNLQHQKHLPN